MIRHRDELAGEDLELLKILDLTKGISHPSSSRQVTRSSLSDYVTRHYTASEIGTKHGTKVWVVLKLVLKCMVLKME